MTTFDLLLIGYGNVATRFVSLLEEQRTALARRYGLRACVIGIATRRTGGQYVASAFQRTKDGPAKAGPHERTIHAPAIAGPHVRTTPNVPTLDFVADACVRDAAAAKQARLVVVETTTLDIAGRGEPAIGHIRAALSGGAHVITANKGPVAFAYRALARAARRANRRFLFEGAVMDGVPVFNLVRETLPAVRIVGFRGVVNSTTNYILTAMQRGQPFDEALADMQAQGVAEADASLDVDGWDAAAKTAALANVLLGAAITPLDVERMGITQETGQLAIDARTAGRRLKLVARAVREGRRVVARVAPEELPEDDLLARLEGRQNAIILGTDLLEEIAVVQRSGSLTQTAYALLSDLITIARDVTRAAPSPPKGAARAIRRSPSPARRRRSP
jgi:homoserine dehydrogenase